MYNFFFQVPLRMYLKNCALTVLLLQTLFTLNFSLKKKYYLL